MSSPVEIRGGVSAISIGDRAIISRPPFTAHFERVPLLGDKRRKRIVNAPGSWFIGHSAVGDFTGTEEGGVGGPADLAAPYGPTGPYTFMAAGLIAAGTSASTTTFDVPTRLDQLPAEASETVLTVTSASWNNSGNTLTKTGAFASYSFTAGDVVFISAPAGCIKGYFTIASRTSDDVIVLDAAIKGSTSNNNVDFTIERIKWTYRASVMKRWGTPISDTDADWTAATRTITETGAFASYTFTGDDWCHVTQATGGETGWYRIESRTSDDAIVLTSDASVLSSTDLSGVVNFTIYPAHNSVEVPDADYAYATKTITSTGAFTSYTPGTDDTIWFRDVDGDTDGYFAKVVSSDTNDTAVIDIDPFGADFTGTIQATLLKRGSFETSDLHTAPFYGKTTGNVNSVIKLVDALTFTPAIGDLYYVYPYDTSDLSDYALQSADNNNELTPVDVDSSTTTQNSFHPYWTPSRCTLASYQGYSGRGNYASSHSNTDINLYWHGVFETPAETFCYGDQLNIELMGDVLYGGTPYFIEVLIIPNFNPEEDWYKAEGLGMPSMLLDSGYSKVIVLQTPVITNTATRSLNINIVGRSLGYSDEALGWNSDWQMTTRLGTTGPTDITGVVPSPLYNGPYERTILNTAVAFGDESVRWTVLMKAEHPFMRGKPGFHGYYMGEPFSTTTGNGFTFLHHGGRVSSTELPYSPAFRMSGFTVDHTPAGSF